MSDISTELHQHIMTITLNRIDKHNAFDDKILIELQKIFAEAGQNAQVRMIILKANGKCFSAGADLHWMQRMAEYTYEENLKDAKILAKLMYTIYATTKPCIALVQGPAFGGGAGLVAACDIAIAAQSATFCFSEVKLGLIPAVISPYIIQAVGTRAANWLFMSAENINAERAEQLGLVQYVLPDEGFSDHAFSFAEKFIKFAPEALRETKSLVKQIANHTITEKLLHFTAEKIAHKRISAEGQRGLKAFLNKEPPQWD